MGDPSAVRGEAPQCRVLIPFGTPYLYGLERGVIEAFDSLRPDVDPLFIQSRWVQDRGLPVIEELRRRKVRTPVIILSAKRSVDDRVKGLQSGSDDYLTKPFSFAELLARIHALLRRATQGGELSALVVGDLSLDLLTRDCTRSGRKIELQPREFALLEYLMRNVGRVLTKTLILEHVWGYHFYPQTNVVDVLVSRLRNKVDREFDVKLIHTIRGVGYALKQSCSSS